MSFASDLIRRKQELKSCQTVVTSPEGKKFLEKVNDSGVVETELLERCPGFVVDEKLDLEIAQILEFLFLSSQDAAQDVELLKKIGISHVLSVGVVLPDVDSSAGIKFENIQLLDEPDSDLEKVFESSFDLIDRFRRESQKNKILVHCNAGFSRAPTIVIGYLMKTLGCSLEESFNLVKEKRNVKPNVGFMEQLKKLEKDLAQGDWKGHLTNQNG